MSKQSIKRSRQSGFTLIELVVVIVILGILAATAIPKFADLSTDARKAKLQAAQGSVKGAAATAHALWLAAGGVDSQANVTMEGTTVALAHGYPSAVGVQAAAGGLDDYNTAAASGVLTINPDSDHTTNCSFTYTEAASAGAAPVTSAVTSSGC